MILFVIWLGLTYVVHVWLWGGYEPPSEDFSFFFVIDAFLAFLIVAVFAWALDRFKKRSNDE